MVFWIVVGVVLLLVLGAAWWSDYRRRGLNNPFGRRKQLHDDQQVNEARFAERNNDLFNGGGSI